MVVTVPSSSSGVDALKEGRLPWRSTVGSHFEWVLSSPSSVEVVALEESFPNIIQIPAEVLAEEERRWELKVVIARSLSRWIPPDAIIREFRCSGVSGEVEAVSLAHRCYIFCFSDPIAKDLVLGCPWIVNGQVLTTEAWRSDFISTVNSVTSALLWLRLPNLPLEFWHEDILRSILSLTGEFVALDPSTKNKTRGVFARACMQVDLGRPLRPGVHVREVAPPSGNNMSMSTLKVFASTAVLCTSVAPVLAHRL